MALVERITLAGSRATDRLTRPARVALLRAGGYVAMAYAIAMIGLPLLWMLSAAFKQTREIYVVPPSWIPQEPTLSNFTNAWHAAPFGRYFLNSTLVTLIGASGKLLNGLLSAYALAFLRFPRKNLVFLVVLAGLMVPPQVTVLPNYLIMADLGWVNTYQGIVVPSLATAVGVFLLRQAFLSLPREVIDAARVDGAGHAQVLWDVLIPMARPVVVTFLLLAVVSEWNEFLWPLVVTSTASMRTLPIGIFWLLDQEGNTQWGVVMAGVIFVIAPLIAVFLFAQRHIVEGIAAGAVKS